MFFITNFTKFYWAISVELWWRIVLSSIYNYGQIFKFKKEHDSQKKNWIKISCGYAHLHNYKVSRNSVERFQWSCGEELFSVVSLILVNILSSKRCITPRKKNWIKISRNSVKRFQRSCADNYFSSIFHFGLSRFKKGVKKIESKLPVEMQI